MPENVNYSDMPAWYEDSDVDRKDNSDDDDNDKDDDSDNDNNDEY